MDVWAALLIRMIFHDSKPSEKDLRMTVQQSPDKEYTIKEKVWFPLSTIDAYFAFPAMLLWKYQCGYLGFLNCYL
jgi:hypothetical protein